MKTPAHYRPGLDLVRLGALLPVLCYHFCIEAARLGFAVPTVFIGRAMADWVEVGLAWFFLLSGAALCLQWQGRFRWRPYLVGRAAAMYPAFWLGFGALFLYGEVLHGNNAQIPRWRVIFSVLGLDGYLAPVTQTFYKIGEWFLGVILLLYLLFPLLLWCMETRRRRLVLPAAGVAGALPRPAGSRSHSAGPPARLRAGCLVRHTAGPGPGALAPLSVGAVGAAPVVGPPCAPSGGAAGPVRPAVLGGVRSGPEAAPAILGLPAPPGGLVLRGVSGAPCAADAGIAARCPVPGIALTRMVPRIPGGQLCPGRSAYRSGRPPGPVTETGRLKMSHQKAADACSVRGFAVMVLYRSGCAGAVPGTPHRPRPGGSVAAVPPPLKGQKVPV